MRKTKPGDMRTITCLSDPKYALAISGGDDASAIKEHLGDIASGYDGFFVHAKDGEYVEVWGFTGVTPRLDKLTTRLV